MKQDNIDTPFTHVDGGVTAAKGYTASGTNVAIKPGSSKKDCALLVSSVPAAVAGVFTTNVVKAAPVYWDMNICEHGNAQAVFINSGNANAATGKQGKEDCRETAEKVATRLGIAPEDVCICSTGVIGVPLPMARIRKGIKRCVIDLDKEGNLDAAMAIMTTDSVPKEMAVSIDFDGSIVQIGAMAKGSGMIAPDMATMLCMITTDALIDSESLSEALKKANEASFNCICVDNDTSTNDTVLCLANGESGVRLEPDTENYATFTEALTYISRVMAKKLVLDGEGATKFVDIQVAGTANNKDAKKIAKAIATSQLCKTAFFGQDANWGRFACAAGYAGVDFDPDQIDIWLGDLQLLEKGVPTDYHEADAAERMNERDLLIRIVVGDGPGYGFYWTSDLSHEYVTINADYRT